VSRQNIRQPNRKGSTAAAALAAVTAKDSLAALHLAIGRFGIISVKLAVPV